MTAIVPRPPLGVRAVNGLLRAFDGVAPGRFPLRVDALCEAARRATGLDDLGDDAHGEPLAALVDGMREDGNLTPFGRFAVRSYVLQTLIERLGVIDAARRDPAVAERHIAPLVVTGFYRSGTTFLHHLLGAMPSVRAPSFGELRSPVRASRPGGTAGAEATARRVDRLHRYLSPGAEDIHPMSAAEPEECVHLFDNAFWSTTSTFISASTRLSEWIVDRDPGPAYRFYRTQLGLLDRIAPTPRWALKWPMHLWWLEALFDTLPAARVVVLERDPADVVPSICSLSELTRTSFCRSIDRGALGSFWLEYLARGRARLEASLPGLPPDRVRRLDYRDFVADPVATVTGLATWAGWNLDGADRAALDARAQRPRSRRRRPHRYSPERFGLTAGGIRERMGWTPRAHPT